MAEGRLEGEGGFSWSLEGTSPKTEWSPSEGWSADRRKNYQTEGGREGVRMLQGETGIALGGRNQAGTKFQRNNMVRINFYRASLTISLYLIIPKLSWRDLLILPSVSHVLRHAIHSGQVYQARVRAHATKSLSMFLKFKYRQTLAERRRDCRLDLRSRKDKREGKPKLKWLLPGIDNDSGEFLSTSHQISFDGKIYLFGAQTSARVLVMDVAGRKSWTECASRQLPPRLFTYCFLRDRKIVLNGPFRGSEIYDPELNSWSFSTTHIRNPAFGLCRTAQSKVWRFRFTSHRTSL